MKKFLAFLLTSAVFLSFSAIVLANESLPVSLPNSGFEMGDSGTCLNSPPVEIPYWTAYKFNTATQFVNAGTEPKFYYGIGADVMAHTVQSGNVIAAPEGGKCFSIVDNKVADSIYLLSDALETTPGNTYTLSVKVWSDYRYGLGIAFLNNAGKVYLNGSYQDYNTANLLKSFGEFKTGSITGRNWSEVSVSSIVAPEGAVTMRVGLFGSNNINHNASVSFDDVRLSYIPAPQKTTIEIQNGDFTKSASIPGWTNYFGSYNQDNTKSYITINTTMGLTGNAMRIVKDADPGQYIFSDPIVVPDIALDKEFKFSFDASKALNGRGGYGIAFFQKGADGLMGTGDDLILSTLNSDNGNLTFNPETKKLTGGEYKYPFLDYRYAVSGGTYQISGGNYLSTNTSGNYEYILSYDSVAGPFHYVRIFFYQRPSFHGTDFAVDNVCLKYGNSSENYADLEIINHNFEQSVQVHNWSVLDDYTPSSTLYYMVTDDVAVGETNALKIIDNDPAKTVGLLSESFDVYEGSLHQLSFSYRSSDRIAYGLIFYNRQGEIYDKISSSYVEATRENILNQVLSEETASAGSVNQKTASYTPPAGAETGRIYLGSKDTVNAFYDNVSLNYEKAAINVEITASSGGTVDKTGIISAEQGDTITLTATPQAGYEIESISYNGITVFSHLNQAKTYTTPGLRKNSLIEVSFRAMPLPQELADSAEAYFSSAEAFVNQEGETVTAPHFIVFSTALPQYGNHIRTGFGVLFSKENLSKEAFISKDASVIDGVGIDPPNSLGQYGIRFYGEGVKPTNTYYTLTYAIFDDGEVETVVYGSQPQSFSLPE